MRSAFDPHQLDFDWRFEQSSALRLEEYIASCTNLLLLGCPSLVEPAEAAGVSGLLLERNPNHRSSSGFHVLHADLRFYQTRTSRQGLFDIAVVDSPWYLDELICWLNIARAYTKLGGAIFFVLWPEDTRPSAPAEHKRLFSLLKGVGSLKNLGMVSYQTPIFEKHSCHPKNFYRQGLLFSLANHQDANLAVRFKRSGSFWRRYQVASKQFAIKINPSRRVRICGKDFTREPFTLTNTSRRNDEVDQINVWTSDNLVANIADPEALDRELRRLRNGASSDFALNILAKLNLVTDNNPIEWGETWLHRA